MSSKSQKKLVLVAGATGHVGHQVVQELLKQGALVRALVRPGSSVAGLEGVEGVTVARGDVLDLSSLESALVDCDAVINAFAGYTGRRATDTSEIDVDGNINVAKAAMKQRVPPRVVLLGIVASELAPTVPHFDAKKRAEDGIRATGAPFVFIRAGAFFDQGANDMAKENFLKGRYVGVGDRTTKFAYTYTPKLAEALAKAAIIDDDRVVGKTISVGASEPMSHDQILALIQKYTGKSLSAWIVPWWFVSGVGRLVGLFKPIGKDMALMFEFFKTGKYVITQPNEAAELLGLPNPSPDEFIEFWAKNSSLLATAAKA